MYGDERRDLHVRVARAADVDRELKDSKIGQALESIRLKHLAAIEGSDPTDKDAREFHYGVLRGIREVREELTRVISDGKIAGNRLDQKDFQARVGGDARSWSGEPS